MKKGSGLRSVNDGGPAPSLLEAFNDLFRGRDDVYGQYEKPTGTKKGGQKNVGRALNVREPLTLDQWKDHLSGKVGLGIVPTMLDKLCWWGGLDIDDYVGFKHAELAKQLEDDNLPLIVCRTKSGGAHVLMFVKEPVLAADMRQKLREIAAGLGYHGCEVNPKQAEILDARGDIGSWLNMPYFGGDATERYAIMPDGSRLTAEQFVKHAQSLRLTAAQFEAVQPPAAEEQFPEGPPCLQYIGRVGLDSGERNKGITAVAIFWRKADPKDWKDRVEKANQQLTHGSPLDAAELAQLIKSIEKKDYNYSCKEMPLARYCNSIVCRTRKYGVSGGEGMPSIGGLTMLATDPPIWFLDVEDTRIELTTEELQNQGKFQRRCMERLTMMPPRQKEASWQVLVQGLLEKCEILEAPPDASIDGEFRGLLEGFTTSKSCHPTREGLLMGKPFKHEEEGRVYFRLMDLLRYLHQHGFKDYRHAQLASKLKNIDGVKHGFANIEGRGVNWWSIPVDVTDVQVPIPEMRKKAPF